MNNSQYIRRAQYKKGFITPLILAIIAILAIGGGYLYLQKKPINRPLVIETPAQGSPATQVSDFQTADWKTYTNTQYGFELKYPQSFQVTQKGNSFDVTLPSFHWRIASIFVFTQEEYNSFRSDSMAYVPGRIISQNSTHVVTYAGPQECPDRALCASNESAIRQIPLTFKFTK